MGVRVLLRSLSDGHPNSTAQNREAAPSESAKRVPELPYPLKHELALPRSITGQPYGRRCISRPGSYRGDVTADGTQARPQLSLAGRVD